MIKVYGSPHCPDCVRFQSILENNRVEFEYIDITASIRNLKEFLALRDHCFVYDEAKANGYVGIPSIVSEDGAIRLDYEEWILENNLAEADAASVSQSCNVDGTDC